MPNKKNKWISRKLEHIKEQESEITKKENIITIMGLAIFLLVITCIILGASYKSEMDYAEKLKNRVFKVEEYYAIPPVKVNPYYEKSNDTVSGNRTIPLPIPEYKSMPFYYK